MTKINSWVFLVTDKQWNFMVACGAVFRFSLHLKNILFSFSSILVCHIILFPVEVESCSMYWLIPMIPNSIKYRERHFIYYQKRNHILTFELRAIIKWFILCIYPFEINLIWQIVSWTSHKSLSCSNITFHQSVPIYNDYTPSVFQTFLLKTHTYLPQQYYS